MVVDAVFITIWFVRRIPLRPERDRWIFVGIWTAATLIVVLRGLAEVKKARMRLRAGTPVR